MTDEPYKDPEHAIPYLKLIKLGVTSWNHWIRGELTAEKSDEISAKLGLKRLPTIPAEFEDSVNFSGVNFSKDGTWLATFSGANFADEPDFSGAVFSRETDFSKAVFGDGANFSKALFEDETSFAGAAFGIAANFQGTVFDVNTSFVGAEFDFWASFAGAEFGDGADFSGGKASPQKTKLEAISFAGTTFRGDVFFRDRQFKDYINFSHAQFDQPPTFENCDGMDRLDVTGTKFGFTGTKPKFWWWEKKRYNQPGWTTDSNIPTRLRILRKQMEDIKAHDAERDLFIAERMAERGVLIAKDRFGLKTIGALFLFFMYQTLSDCGRSILRPFLWFMGKMAFFFTLYGLMKDAGQFFRIYDIPNGWPGDFLADILSFTLGHALPFATSLGPVQKDVMLRLFGKEIDGHRMIDMPLSIELLSIGQSIIGALLLFLFLQAVRNHFRLR